MEVVIDGVRYVPAKGSKNKVLANRDAIIRGLTEQFWGGLPQKYDEEDKLGGLFIVVTDSPPWKRKPEQDFRAVLDKIAEYAEEQSDGR